MAYPRRFRTYDVRSNSNMNCKIWQAVRATMATPTIFKSISIGEEDQIPERFIDGGLKGNNPVKEVMDESRLVFGDDRLLGVLVNLGAGYSGTIGLSTPDTFQRVLPTDLLITLKNLAVDCESTAEEVKHHWKNIPDRYFRFSVTHGTEGISLEEWKKMEDVQAHTKSYLRRSEVSDAIDSLVERLCGSTSATSKFTLGEACTSFATLQIPYLFHSNISIILVGPMKEAKVDDSQSTIYDPPLPTPSTFFTGREEILGKLKDHFALRDSSEGYPRRSFLLYGLGGGGKTQICAKFIEKHSYLSALSVFLIQLTSNSIPGFGGSFGSTRAAQPLLHKAFEISLDVQMPRSTR